MRTYDEIINDYYSWYGAGKVTPEELDYASEVELSIYAPMVRKEMRHYSPAEMCAFIDEVFQNDQIMTATMHDLMDMVDPEHKVDKHGLAEEYGGNPLMIY